MEPEYVSDREEVVQRPERHRRKGLRFVRSALHTLADPPFFALLTFSCIYVLFVGLCVIWVLCGSSKATSGATPPSVMVSNIISTVSSANWAQVDCRKGQLS